VFGSFATGLNLPKSDIDIVCIHPSVSETTLIHRISYELHRSGLFTKIINIKSTKCPIIKLTDKETGIPIDLSFNRENGLQCVELIKGLY
jgi:non-canonical poly(A) RNA polymerase PAPD5/7